MLEEVEVSLVDQWCITQDVCATVALFNHAVTGNAVCPRPALSRCFSAHRYILYFFWEDFHLPHVFCICINMAQNDDCLRGARPFSLARLLFWTSLSRPCLLPVSLGLRWQHCWVPMRPRMCGTALPAVTSLRPTDGASSAPLPPACFSARL